MANVYVLDTMVTVYWLSGKRLTPSIQRIFESGSVSIRFIIPAISLAEIAYLYEKERITIGLSDVRSAMVRLPGLEIASDNLEITELAFTINDVPELHDRLIAATSLYYQAILLTNDPVLRKSKRISTLW